MQSHMLIFGTSQRKETRTFSSSKETAPPTLEEQKKNIRMVAQKPDFQFSTANAMDPPCNGMKMASFGRNHAFGKENFTDLTNGGTKTEERLNNRVIEMGWKPVPLPSGMKMENDPRPVLFETERKMVLGCISTKMELFGIESSILKENSWKKYLNDSG